MKSSRPSTPSVSWPRPPYKCLARKKHSDTAQHPQLRSESTQVLWLALGKQASVYSSCIVDKNLTSYSWATTHLFCSSWDFKVFPASEAGVFALTAKPSFRQSFSTTEMETTESDTKDSKLQGSTSSQSCVEALLHATWGNQWGKVCRKAQKSRIKRKSSETLGSSASCNWGYFWHCCVCKRRALSVPLAKLIRLFSQNPVLFHFLSESAEPTRSVLES